MTTSAEFIKAREVQSRLDKLTAKWVEVAALINNHHLREALNAVEEALPLVDEAGDTFTVPYYPHCLGCDPPGSAEVTHPTEPGRKLVCYLASGDAAGGPYCCGNTVGRMHPVQLKEFIEARLAYYEPKVLPLAPVEPNPTPLVLEPITPTLSNAAPLEPQAHLGS